MSARKIGPADGIEGDAERFEEGEAITRREVDPPQHARHDRVDDRDPADPHEEGRDGRQPARFSSNVHIDTLSLDGHAPRLRPTPMVGRAQCRGDGAGTRPMSGTPACVQGESLRTASLPRRGPKGVSRRR